VTLSYPAVLAQVRDSSQITSKATAVLHDEAPLPNFLLACSVDLNTTACRNQEVHAIDNARRSEALPAIGINLTAFDRLSAAQQLFVITNLERTTRQLAPVGAMTSQLNNEAARGAANSTDPPLEGWTLTGGKAVTSWVSNWAGGLSVLGADYFWMYDDGVGFNAGCTTTTSSGCWAHRDNMLVAKAPVSSCTGIGDKPELLMGAAVDPWSYRGATSIAQLIVRSCGGLPSDTTFTWASARRLMSITNVS
jgi:hypothetical protein